MKKIIFGIIIVLSFLFFGLGQVDANLGVKAVLKTNQNTIEKEKEIVVVFRYDEIKEGINTYKATLEYDEKVFEEVLEKDFKTLNAWTEFKYNKNTKEFIAIKKEGSKDPEDVLQIILKVKTETNIKETNIKIKDIIASEGENDIKIDEVNLKLNIVFENIKEDNIQNSEQENEKIPNEQEKAPTEKEENTLLDKEQQEDKNNLDKKEESDNLFFGVLPKAGEDNIHIFILLAIVILLVIAFISRKKYKQIEKKHFKLFTTILLFTVISIQLMGNIYSNNTKENLKGKLNDDLEINYEDVTLLQLHLIHIKNLSDDKINNADLNDDNKVTLTDLSLLIKYIEENKNFIEVSEIDYTETLDNIENPERGFYTPININMKQENNSEIYPKGNLIHLRVGIGEFSGKINKEKQDVKFSDDMLESLNKTLENIKKNNGNVIIRFSYDNFEGIENAEPNLEMILTHISQLKPIFNTNKDVISYVELGFFRSVGRNALK